MKTRQIWPALLGLCLCVHSLYGQTLSSQLTKSWNDSHRESLTEAERKLWKSLKKTDFVRLKERRFSKTQEAETAFRVTFDLKRQEQTLALYYFIPREYLAIRPTVEIRDCRGASTRLKKEIFTRDGLIVYDVFPLERPAGFSEDNVRFKASVPGKLVAFLN